MKKQHILLMSVLLIILGISGALFQKNNNKMEDKKVEAVEEEKRSNTLNQENEDVSYVRSDDSDEDIEYGDYEDLMETFRTAIIDQWDQDKLDEEDLGPHPYAPSTLPYDYGYIFRDLNNDGIEEMVVGYNFDEETPLITEIYTIVNNTPFKFFASGIRHSADIYPDGTIVESAITSPGLGHQLYEVYDLAADGTKNIKDGYTYDGREETYESLVDPNELMDEEDAKELWETYTQAIELSFTPFVSDKSDIEQTID